MAKKKKNKSLNGNQIYSQRVGNNLLENHECLISDDWENPLEWIKSVSNIFQPMINNKNLLNHFLKFAKVYCFCDICENEIMYCECCGKYFDYCQQCWGLIDFVYRHPAHENPVCEECCSR